MAFEKSTCYPSEDSHADHLYESLNAFIIILELITFIYSFEEEHREGFERVLVHVIYNTQFNDEEVEHSTFSSDSSVDFSKNVNLDFSFFSFSLLYTDLNSSFLGCLELLNECEVLKNCSWISLGEGMKKIGF